VLNSNHDNQELSFLYTVNDSIWAPPQSLDRIFTLP